MPSRHELALQFARSYTEEFDHRHARANLPTNPGFVKEVEVAVEVAVGAVGVGFLAKMGADLYDLIKKEFFALAWHLDPSRVTHRESGNVIG